MIQIWKQRCTRIIWRTKNPWLCENFRCRSCTIPVTTSCSPWIHDTHDTHDTQHVFFQASSIPRIWGTTWLDMTWPCLKHFKTVYVGLSWSTLLEHGIVWIVTIATSLCHLSGIARSRCKLAGCSWSSKQQISQILSCSQMAQFRRITAQCFTRWQISSNICALYIFVHACTILDASSDDFCRCLQHLTVPSRVWGPAQTAAASTSDASTSTSYGRLGPYRQSTCDILRPFVTFCDHLWPLRKKRWLFSDYLVNLVTIYDYLVNLVTTLRFIMFHMFHAIDDQSASDIFGQCQGHQQQKVNPMSLPPSDCCICCAG